MTDTFVRFSPLDDIRIRSGGDGRTVEAYAAVFGEPADVMDQDGYYRERNAPAAFNKTIADHQTFPVIYQHGLTINGTPSDRGSVPIGVSVEVKPDPRGLLTVSRYSHTTLADEVLEGIRDGSIRGQSYGGRFVRSDPARKPRGGYRPGADGSLRTVTRLEVAMREFGPTPFPAFPGAEILGARAQPAATLAAHLQQLAASSDDVDDLLLRYFLSRRMATAPVGQPDDDDGTADTAAADQTEHEPPPPPPGHSRRSTPLSTRIRAARIARGMETTR